MLAGKMPVVAAEGFIATLNNCGGYYACPKDAAGKRTGKMVVYAGKYETPSGPKNYVGDEYFNCARIERFPWILRHYAQELARKIRELRYEVDWIMGVPDGGRSLGQFLAEELGCEYIYPDKEKSKADGDQREETVMTAGRHEIEAGTRGIIVEDVCNNFSSTAKVVELIESHGATVLAIACLLNRSPVAVYQQESHHPLRVFSIEYRPTVQYRQDDEAVAADIAAGRLETEVKKNWKVLQASKVESEPAGAFVTGAGP